MKGTGMATMEGRCDMGDKRHTTEVEYNILSTEPTHCLYLWIEKMEAVDAGGYWQNGYVYQGSVWGIINPKVGHVVATHRGKRYRIVRLGVEWNNDDPPQQVKVAYATPWRGG